ncbi:MAG: ATP-binding response regulator [Woeseiaceae bacterium]
MEFPERVVEYLQSDFLTQTRPYCFLLDQNFELLETWGDGHWCGLGELVVGVDMREAAPFLVGMRLDAAHKLELLETPGRVIVNLHIIPEGDTCYVVLLDAREEHDSLQLKQQRVNEMRILHTQQHKLISRQRELISDLVETRAELDHHRREAERVSANKSRFIAMMSHEFRTPLASIINYADLAVDGDTSENNVLKSIETISRSARHLTSLVESVLDDASLEAGQIELTEQDFDIYDLLDDLSAMMAPLAAEKGLSFQTSVDKDLPRIVHADEVRLRQILINLLGNAVKFTLSGSVRLMATYNDGRLIVTVSDTGPGISADDQERVFQAFERGSDSAKTGAGLGLTITLRLVELMQGEVSLDSSPGDGCTVSVHVPVGEGVHDSANNASIFPVPDADTIAAKPLSILLCDDDDDMVVLLEHYLHRSGYGLITSADTAEAISKAIKYAPDLILMDCNVPGVGGVAAAKALREKGYTNPIVALTASKLSDDEKEAFTKFFRKPAPMQELLVEIRRLTH